MTIGKSLPYVLGSYDDVVEIEIFVILYLFLLLDR